MPIGLMPPLPYFLSSVIARHAIYDSSDFGSTHSVHILLPKAAKDSQRLEEEERTPELLYNKRRGISIAKCK